MGSPSALFRDSQRADARRRSAPTPGARASEAVDDDMRTPAANMAGMIKRTGDCPKACCLRKNAGDIEFAPAK